MYFKFDVIAAITLGAFAASTITGCASSNPPKLPEPSALLKKHKDLPNWVNDDAGMYVAVGSARFKGQTYIQQKMEAELIANGELAMKIEKRLDALAKAYHRSTGQSQSYNEDVFKSVISSVTSQTLSGIKHKEVYVADDGEMFVKVELDPEYLSQFLKSNYASNQTRWQMIQADQAFKELDDEARKYREEHMKALSNLNKMTPLAALEQ